MAESPATSVVTRDLEEALRLFPEVLEALRRSYGELEERAQRVERALVRTNAELEHKVGELDALKRHLEAVLESLPNGVIERDASGCVVRANRAAQRILGVQAEEIVAAGEHPALPEPAGDGEPRAVALPDGRRLVLASHYATVQLADGTVAGAVEILEDRTEETALAERLHAADKMAALGTLAAGVAHEIRNPLNAVQGFASLLQRELGGREGEGRLRAWAEHVVAGAREVDALVENMLSFGSPERLRADAIDGEELLRGALAAAGLVPGEGIELACDAPPFVGDRLKLRQALRNLIANAVRAQGVDRRLAVSLSLDAGEVVLRVADAGPGIPDELAARVFDPFFTTHADGTGLGLALVATIARLHGGRAEVAPEPSALGGAELLLRIPHRPVSQPDVQPLDPSKD